VSKPASPELVTLIAGRVFYRADLYTIVLTSGQTLRYTSGDQDITANGFLYSSGGQVGPYFDLQGAKAQLHYKVGTEVDTLTFGVIPGGATVGTTPFLQAIHDGLFDGALISMERAYMPITAYGDTSRGTILTFVGRAAEIDAGRSTAEFNVSSHLELLNTQMPRNLVQPGCVNNLGDATCTVSLNSYKTTGTVSSGTTIQTVNATLVGSFSAGTFDYGTITFTSGVNNGLTFDVKTCVFGSPNVITLLGFMAQAPGVGDAFNLFYGCDKSYTGSNGCTKFANTSHFRGWPFVPQASVAV